MIDCIYHSYITIFLAYIDTQTMETMLELYSRNGRSKTSSFHQPLLYNSSWALGELRTNLESTWMFALNKFQELSKELKEEIKDSNEIKRNVDWHVEHLPNKSIVLERLNQSKLLDVKTF